MATSSARKHILLVAPPAYGHLIPLLELAKKIAQHHQVTFAVSEFRLPEMHNRELIPANCLFPVIGIPDGYYEGNDEIFMTLPVFKRLTTLVVGGAKDLFLAVPVQGTSPSTGNSLGITIPVDVVIADNMFCGAMNVLPGRGIQYYLFNIVPSSRSLFVTPEMEDDGIEEPEIDEIPFYELPKPGGKAKPIPLFWKKVCLNMHNVTLSAAGIVANSVYELDAPLIDIIKSHPTMKNIPFYCVGPLIPEQKTNEKLLQEEEKVKKWLDKQEKQSVIYVSFGTIAIPKPEQISELIKALLATKKPFIWSLPKKEHFRLPEEIVSNIPQQQFDCGNSLILSWAPQKLILQHESTAVFLSHCGWNSILESIATGVPVVAWPMFADQQINALNLMAKGTGWLIEGTGLISKTVIYAAEIQEAIEETAGFGNASGESKYRTAAKQWKEKLDNATGHNGSSQRDFLDLINFK